MVAGGGAAGGLGGRAQQEDKRMDAIQQPLGRTYRSSSSPRFGFFVGGSPPSYPQ